MSEARGARSIDIGVVVDLLAARAPQLVLELLPGGTRQGAEWVCGSAASPFGCSVSVHLAGARAGVWSAWAAGSAGDALDLIALTKFSGDKRQALHWARSRLAFDSAAAPLDRYCQQAKAREEQSRRADVARSGAAMRVFLESQPSIVGTPTERYLIGRAINVANLGRQPRALRFHSRLWHSDSRRTWPALVAGIANPEGKMVAVHRTWLGENPDGTVAKAPVSNPKMTLGSYRGACIRLWRGASGKPLKDAPQGETVLICEGIEDGLSAAVAAPEYRVLCAVSLSNMGALELPEAIKTVVILGQNDEPGSAAVRTLHRAIAAFRAQGRTVKVATPPPLFKDINDVLRAAAEATQ